MRFDILTIFPNFFSGPLDHGILSRAIATGTVEVATHDLRQFTHDRHRTVDDRPFGGGEGMVLKAQPIFECVESFGASGMPIAAKGERDTSKQSVILLSAQGRRFTQAVAHRLATLEQVVLICGRYEGVDERVNDLLADEELSIGDYVLSGGELAAAVMIDAIVRLLPGVLGHIRTLSRFESFGAGDGCGSYDHDRLASPQGDPWGRWSAGLSALHASGGFWRQYRGARGAAAAAIMRRFGCGGGDMSLAEDVSQPPGSACRG